MPSPAALVLAMAIISGPHAASSCFDGMGPVRLPERRLVLQHVGNGETGREIADAVMRGDLEAVTRLARHDPQLLATHIAAPDYPDFAPDGAYGDLLVFAVARCDAAMLRGLLELGLPPDGVLPGAALDLSIQANTPDFMLILLEAGADPDPQKRGGAYPLDTAAARRNAAAARLLLEHGADVHWANAFGYTPLHEAVSRDAMEIAELLIDHGADPWRASRVGQLPAYGIAQPLTLRTDADAAARDRLIARLRGSAAGWPPPDPQTVRRLALAGNWPGAERRAAGVPDLPEGALDYLRENYAPDGSAR